MSSRNSTSSWQESGEAPSAYSQPKECGDQHRRDSERREGRLGWGFGRGGVRQSPERVRHGDGPIQPAHGDHARPDHPDPCGRLAGRVQAQREVEVVVDSSTGRDLEGFAVGSPAQAGRHDHASSGPCARSRCGQTDPCGTGPAADGPRRVRWDRAFERHLDVERGISRVRSRRKSQRQDRCGDEAHPDSRRGDSPPRCRARISTGKSLRFGPDIAPRRVRRKCPWSREGATW